MAGKIESAHRISQAARGTGNGNEEDLVYGIEDQVICGLTDDRGREARFPGSAWRR